MTAIDVRPALDPLPVGPAALEEHRRIPTPALLAVLVGAFLAMADFFIVNVALGDIGTRLDASTATLELVVAGYGVTYALLLVVGGRLGDALGRKQLFLAGMAAFTLTLQSRQCVGLALHQVVVARPAGHLAQRRPAVDGIQVGDVALVEFAFPAPVLLPQQRQPGESVAGHTDLSGRGAARAS